MGRDPSPEVATQAFQNSMFYEIVFTFGVPDHDCSDYAHWEFINLSRVAHARVLYAFLETPKAKRYQDDLLAEDFGYPAQPGILSADNRERMNKDMLHLSCARTRHTPLTKIWPHTILGDLLYPTLGFMNYIDSNRPDLFNTKSEARGWSQLIGHLESGRHLGMRVTGDSRGFLIYQFALGPPLPDGKPRMTDFGNPINFGHVE
jgi:hypothetical protein